MIDRPERSLELTRAQMKARLEQVAERLLDYVDGLDQSPAGFDLDAIQPRVGAPDLPERGRGLESVLDELFDVTIPPSFNSAGPGYLAYVPGGGIFDAALGRFVADVVNRYTGVWAAAPRMVQLETDVLSWFAAMVGYPTTARGVLVSGGSLATLTALVTARTACLPEDFLDGVIYVGDQAHHCIAKAASLAGFPRRSVVTIATDGAFRLRVDQLQARVAADRAAGRRPFLVAASAGTTNTGAVDGLDATADLCRDQGLWLHVDAAYGGFFALTATGRELLRGLGRSDSLVLDPHKGLFLPFGTGAVIVRDGDSLRRAHTVTADYMPALQTDPSRVDPCEYGPELSKPWRGLGVWLPLMLHGAEPFRRYLEEKLELAQYAAAALGEIPGIELVAAPQLTILAFRLVQPGLAPAALDDLNRRLLAGIVRRDRVWLNGTVLRERFVIRIAILHFRTHRDRVDACLEDIALTVGEL